MTTENHICFFSSADPNDGLQRVKKRVYVTRSQAPPLWKLALFHSFPRGLNTRCSPPLPLPRLAISKFAPSLPRIISVVSGGMWSSPHPLIIAQGPNGAQVQISATPTPGAETTGPQIKALYEGNHNNQLRVEISARPLGSETTPLKTGRVCG